MESKQTDERLLNEEAKEVFVSRKNRHQLMDQLLKKVRWRFNHENKIETNGKLVKWDDGSYGIYVGDKYYDIEGESPANQMVYTVEEGTMLLQDQVAYSGKIRQFKLPKVR
jgi:hypothetical protein